MAETLVQVPLRRESVIEVRRKMAGYVRLAGDVPTRCGSCAFWEGSAANQSVLVPLQIESCLLSGDTFMCHHDGSDPPKHPCAGYVALRETLVRAHADA